MQLRGQFGLVWRIVPGTCNDSSYTRAPQLIESTELKVPIDGARLYSNYFTVISPGKLPCVPSIALYLLWSLQFGGTVDRHALNRSSDNLIGDDVYRCSRLRLFQFENRQMNVRCNGDWMRTMMFNICLRCCRMTMTSP